MYLMPAFSAAAIYSSGSCMRNISTWPINYNVFAVHGEEGLPRTIPLTFTAYKPGLYPCRRCHLQTQLSCALLDTNMMPSKTSLVQSSTPSGLLRSSRKSSQLGHPLFTNLACGWTTEQTRQARELREVILWFALRCAEMRTDLSEC